MAARLRRPDLTLALGLLAVIGLRGLVVAVASRSCPDAMATPDTPSYELPARALVDLGCFLEAPVSGALPETVRTPGYPFFLALHRWVDFDRSLVGFSQTIVFAVGLLVLLRSLAGSGHRRAAAVALWLAAFEPVSLGHAARINSDLLFVGLLLLLTPILATLLFPRDVGFLETAMDAPAPVEAKRSRHRRPISSLLRPFGVGLALGGLALVRPIAYFFPFALAIAAVIHVRVSARRTPARRPGNGPRTASARAWILVFLGWVTVCGGWQLRNHLVADTWEFSTVTGRNLYRYRAASIVSMRDGIPLALARDSLMAALPDVEALPAAEKSRAFRKAALPILKAHPALVARSALEGAGRMLLVPGETVLLEVLCVRPPSEGALGDLSRLSPPAYARKWLGEHRGIFAVFSASLLHLWVLLAGSVIGVFLLWRRRLWNPLHTVLATEIVYFVVLSAGPEADPRFRLPVVPALTVLAATAVTSRSRAQRN